MCVLVWGFGNYYRRKEESIPKDSILAFVSGKESGSYKGKEIISPVSILRYQFSKLYIMTSRKTIFDILDEMRSLGYQEWDKVVFGCNLKPFLENESLLFDNGEMRCNSHGVCQYVAQGQKIIIRNEEEWDVLERQVIRRLKKNTISNIPLEPISRVFGLDRGLPIDRYYIECFLKAHSIYIQGTVLEVSEQKYTLKYGTRVEKSYVMHVSDSIGENGIVADLETGEGVIDGLVDCFILTQTLPFIFDIRTVAENVIRFLKTGGTALITVSGITQISRFDMDRWGHYWSFTTASLRRLFETCAGVESVEVKAYGNVKSVVYGLYGVAVEEIEQDDLMYQDDDYQQIITAVVRKA